jgi:peptidoglycan-N-acetylglucosamine deacetylase
MRRLLWIVGMLTAALVLFWEAFPVLLPRLLSWYCPDIIYRGDDRRKMIYLTIDDSPTRGTDAILRVLAKYQVSATFFVISGRVKSESQLRSIVAAGHSLGNHLRTTRACTKLNMDEFRDDFDATDRMIRGFPNSRYFRPPSGFCTADQASYARSRGYRPVLGTIYPLDAQIQRKTVIQLLIRWLTIRGGILIMHDGDEQAATTAAVLDELIPALKRQGFELASLDDLPPGNGR